MNSKNLFCAVVSIAALSLAACSSSSGGGAGPAKPNLGPATEVGQSFAVVKYASPQQSNQVGLQLNRGINAATSIDNKAVRTQALKQLIADPQQCQMSMSLPSNGQTGNSQPGNGPIETYIGISGTNCPIEASFSTVIEIDKNMNNNSKIEYSFQTHTADAAKIIGASRAYIAGELKFGPSADKSGITGAGKITGFVNSITYGKVNLT